MSRESPTLFAPEPYTAADAAAIVRRHPFGLLVTTQAGEPFCTSTPMYFADDEAPKTLVGHLARRNPHAQMLHGGQRSLAVFSGPNAYISAAWYQEKPEVPTWNYVAAHVRGVLSPVDDPSEQLAILQHIAEVQERDSDDPWTLARAPQGRVETLLPHIRSFRITIERIEGVTKLSQTHPRSDRLRIIGRLLARGDGDAADIARLMSDLGLDRPTR